MAYRRLVTSHTNTNLSGVAKFNALLAGLLKVPCVGISKVMGAEEGPLLVSIKLADNGHAELDEVKRVAKYLRDKKLTYDLFFHTFDGLDVEYDLVESSRRVYCANGEILHALEGAGKDLRLAWCPALVDPKVMVKESRLNLFSFGMAHKLQLRYYRKLHEVLESAGPDYSVWVSTAFHEKANFGDFNSISRQLSEVFGPHIQFLGFLSDEAINYFLTKTQLFISFFAKGVRSNNTSVSAAMLRGCAVLTNSDEHSPSWMRHNHNILDIHRVTEADLQPSNLAKIARSAKKDAAENASWEGLAALLGGSPKSRPAARREKSRDLIQEHAVARSRK
jgi:hypothetical protein